MEHSPGFLALVADAKTRVRETTPEEVHRRQQAGSRFHFVDVREDGEWEKGHARGAVHLSRTVPSASTSSSRRVSSSLSAR